MVSSETSSVLNSEQDLASIPTAQGGLSRLVIARLKTAGVPVVPLLQRVGLTPELIAVPRLANPHRCTHLARRLSGPPLECMRECTYFAKTEQPRNLGYLQLGVIKVSNCQIAPQLLKYFSEV